jgi:hypothetical protein
MTKSFFLLSLLSLFFLVSCKDERALEAMIWNGGHNEITRNLEDGKEEYIETNEKIFLEFRAMHKEDMKKVIRMARKYCDKGSSKNFTLEETLEREAFFDSLNQANKFLQ